MRFAILREMVEGDHTILLEMEPELVKRKLLLNLSSALAAQTSFLKRGFTKDEVAIELGLVWDSMVSEFKAKTVTLK